MPNSSSNVRAAQSVVLIGTFGFAVMDACSKQLVTLISPGSLLLWRSLLILAALLLLWSVGTSFDPWEQQLHSAALQRGEGELQMRSLQIVRSYRDFRPRLGVKRCRLLRHSVLTFVDRGQEVRAIYLLKRAHERAFECLLRSAINKFMNEG